MAGPNYGGEVMPPATHAEVPQSAVVEPKKRRAQRMSTLQPAVDLLTEADNATMEAQAILVTTRCAILAGDGGDGPDPHSLASVINTVIGIVAGANAKVEEARGICDRRGV